tara:strand:+ start:378 stop:821 length:444 start_codon:yes stop_codon:yes gene_type:complete
MDRKWLPNIAELIDRLSIHQLKEVLLPEHKEKYAKEMKDICHDIDIILKENNIDISADFIRAIVVISQINAHIWYNESNARKGGDQDTHLLKLTHGLNGIRNRSMNLMLDLMGQSERKDWKTDCLAAEFKDWEVSLPGMGPNQNDET